MIIATLLSALTALLPAPQLAAGAAQTPAERAAAPMATGGPTGRVALRGGWVFATDGADRGLRAGWARGRFAGRRVSVPHVANPRTLGRPAAAASYRGSVGWYRRTVTARTAGTYAFGFSSAHWHAVVYLDGRRIGSHTGAYAAFEARAALTRGTHRLAVRVDWRSPTKQSRAGYHRTWFNFGGLNREVTMRRLLDSDLEAPVVQTRIEPDGSARVELAVRVINRAKRARTIGLTGQLGDGGAFAFAPEEIPAGGAAILRATTTVPQPRLWRPGRGELYALTVAVPGEVTYREDVGLRELSWDRGALRVNGAPVVLKGASLHEDVPGHGDALTAADMDATVRRLQAVGATATRAQHPLSPALLERLDRAGIAVWQEIGPVDSPGEWRTDSPALQAVATARVREDFAGARRHPSVIAWSLGCEVAGNGTGSQGAWIARTARRLHAEDPGRPVGVDVWSDHLPDVPGELYEDLDAIGTTSYLGWYEDTNADAEQVAVDLKARLLAFRRTFPDKLQVLAEFGAEGTPGSLNRPEDHGGREYQADLLRVHLAALTEEPAVDAAFVWALMDFAINPAFRGGSITRRVPGIGLTPGLNQKGLFDRAGKAKPAVEAVREGFAGLGG